MTLLRSSSILLAATAVLGSCATYTEPSGGPVAYLTIAAQGAGASIGLGSYCAVKSGLPDVGMKPLRIPAGQRIWLQMSTFGNTYARCRSEVSFVPEPGAHYIAKLESCSFALARAAPGGQIAGIAGLIVEPERNCLLGG